MYIQREEDNRKSHIEEDKNFNAGATLKFDDRIPIYLDGKLKFEVWSKMQNKEAFA